MTIKQFIELLRYDLNDMAAVNTYFGENELASFIMRALYDVVIQLKNCRRLQFFSKEANIDVYPLNRDFISGVEIFDHDSGNKYLYDQESYVSKLRSGIIEFGNFLIDENRRTMIINQIPTDNAQEYTIVGGGVNYITIQGDIQTQKQFYAVNDGTNTFFIRATTFLPDGANTRIYYSEVITPMSDDVYVFPAAHTIREITYTLEYFYIVNRNDYLVNGYANLIANTTTIQTALSTVAKQGDGLYIDGYGTREIVSVNAGNVVVDLPYNQFKPTTLTTLNATLIRWNDNIPITNEIMNVVVQFAKYYALLRVADPYASNQLMLAKSILQDEERRQVEERVRIVNRKQEMYNRRKAYEG